MLANYNKKTGFTMIELLVVATIIIILTTIGMVSFQKAGQTARNGKRKGDIEAVRQALVLYRSDNGEYPDRANYTTMMTYMSGQGYFTNATITDPKPLPHTQYSYTKIETGSPLKVTGFELCAYLEPDLAEYCVNNP